MPKQKNKQRVKNKDNQKSKDLKSQLSSFITDKFQQSSTYNKTNEQNVVIYAGCTNSGKTWASLQELKKHQKVRRGVI
jgi:peptide subunit release factor 1 (eRF1)